MQEQSWLLSMELWSAGRKIFTGIILKRPTYSLKSAVVSELVVANKL